MKIPGRTILLGALVLPAVLLIGGCGADDADSLTAATADSAALAPSDTGAESGSDAGLAYASRDDAAGSKADPDGARVQDRAVISRGQISLHTDDVEKARFELQKLLDTWRGTIADEESDADEDGRTQRARLELRVPSARFSVAMDALADLGTLVDRSRTAEDVTTQVIDNEARIRSQRLSLARVQALLAKARDLDQVIAIESQLSARQADLDSLIQQQKYLADQTSLSTITVYLSVPDEDDVTDDEDGFWSGLESGWKALGTSTEALLTAVGAVLPFAVLVGLVGLPVWIGWRRRTARS